MEGVNLLPWREQQREDRKRQFIAMIVGVILLGVFLIILSHTLVARKIQQQRTVFSFLQTEITDLNQHISEIKNLKKRKKILIQRLKLIHKLQLSRPLIVNVYDELVRIIPSGLYINNIIRKKNILIIKGYSEANTQILKLMKNAKHSKWFTDPQLQEIKTSHKGKKHQHEFTLKLTLKPKQ